jgi:hypothetical protein
MSETKPDDKTDDKTDKDGTVKFSDLVDVVTEVVNDKLAVLKGAVTGTEKTTVDGPESIKEEVQRELEKIHKGQAEKDWREGTEGRLKAVEERTAEKPPVERRRVHKLMGWGE